MPTLRPWSTESTERKWAIGIACACLIILISLPFLPEKKVTSDKREPIEQSITSKQAIAVHAPIKKTSPKPILHPVISHAKNIHNKNTLATKKHSIAIKEIQKDNAPTTSQAYFIQVGAFQHKNHAKKLQKQLMQKHWSVIIQKKKHLYAVQIGPYKNKEKANSMKNKLSHQEKINGFITHHAYP